MNFKCCICDKGIQPARVEFLLEQGTPPSNLTCLIHSPTRRIKGLYSGENGTSDLILCNKVYDDSVRSIFRSAEPKESEEEVDSEE